MIDTIFRRHRRDEDGVFVPSDVTAIAPGAQLSEIEFRRQVVVGQKSATSAELSLKRVAEHHAIPVMDREAARFLETIPKDGWVLDVGGGFGWPWRHLARQRKDVRIVLVDLLRENLSIARAVLGDLVDRQIFLAHGNASRLAFDDGAFNGVWTVQTFQHIAAVEQAYAEAARVLKPGGMFANYALNDALFLRLLYQLCGRQWHREGMLSAYFLRRMSATEKALAEQAFEAKGKERFTEILFCPELRLRPGASPDALIGRLDALIGGSAWQRYFARQHSIHFRKPLP